MFAALLILILAVGVDIFLDGAIRSAARNTLVPIVRIGSGAVAAVSGGDFWSSRQSLLKENETLRSELDKMRARAIGFDAMQQEHDALQRMLHLADDDTAGITAPIISSFRASPYGTFLIGAGSEHGVAKGSIALSEGGFVMGVVEDVNRKNSLVRMVFAPGMKTDVVVGAIGFELTGKGGGNASAEVPIEAALTERSLVLAPVYESRPIGIIGKIESASSSAYADVHVVFPLNLNTVRYVYIVPGNL